MLKILVVDDEVVFAKVLTLTFEDEGWQVEWASGMDEAIEKGKSFEPHILFSDWLLKDGGTGVEVAQVLSGLNPNVKVILITGLPEKAKEAAGESFPIFRLLEKPCDIDDAVQAVKDAMK